MYSAQTSLVREPPTWMLDLPGRQWLVREKKKPSESHVPSQALEKTLWRHLSFHRLCPALKLGVCC